MYPIRIMSRDFQLLGEIDKYTSFIHEASYYGIGNCELHINYNSPFADKIKINDILFPTNELDKAFIVKERELSLSENGKSSEILVIKGPQLKSILSQRLILPPTGSSHLSIESDSETAMHYFVSETCINNADNKRNISRLELGNNLNRGTSRRLQARFEKLSDKIEEVGIFDSLGWDVELDLPSRSFVFNAKQGLNRTISQNLNKRAIFSTDLGTLANFEYNESYLYYANKSIIAGQGEGEERIVVETTSDASDLDLYETFIDAADIENQDEEGNERPLEDIQKDLLERGQTKMTELQQSIYASGETIQKEFNRYGVDYGLGDLVTIVNKKWGVTLDARITKVRTVIEYGRRIIEHTFDNDRPTLITKIKRDINNVKSGFYR